MEAIDFKKLLLEERKKKRILKKSIGADNNGAVIDNNRNDDFQSNFSSDDEDDNTDRQSQNGCPQHENDSKILGLPLIPSWSYSKGFLSMNNLSLKMIRDKNPKSISYSSTVFSTAREIDNNGSDNTNGTLLLPTQALQVWLEELPSGDTGFCEWKTMNHGKRRVCMFGENAPVLPPPLNEIAHELVVRGIFPSSIPPNHVLLNEYQPGQGILPHTDGPLYGSRTATISLGSSVVIEFTKRLPSGEIGKKNVEEANGSKKELQLQESPLQVLLEPGSLLVFQDEAYLNYCHGIPVDVMQDVTNEHCLNTLPNQIIPRELRYSLTFRHKKKKNC